MDRDFRSFEEYFQLYLEQRQKPWTRRVQFLGTSLALGCLASSLLTGQRSLLLGAAAAAFGPAWLSHRLIEKNRPTSPRRLSWRLRADLLLWTQMISDALGGSLHEPDVAPAARPARPSVAEAKANGSAQAPSRENGANRENGASRENGAAKPNGHAKANGSGGPTNGNGKRNGHHADLDELESKELRFRARASRGWAVWE